MKKFQNPNTILLIENNSEWLADVRAMLREAGYDVVTATGGDRGFCAAQRLQPDLIVCEAALPDLSGIQLCYMFRADKNLHTVPLILIGETGDRGSGDAATESVCAGADDFFEKNVQRQFLVVRIARLIALRRAEDELRRRCQNLRRAERHLEKIIEDTFHLAAALDPAQNVAATNDADARQIESLFSSIILPKKLSLKRNSDALEFWRQTLPAHNSAETGSFTGIRREPVYYEVVC